MQHLKSAIGVNTFSMNNCHFLFELPTKVAAEHVMAGKWVWKKMNLNVEWWSPTTGCWPKEIKKRLGVEKRVGFTPKPMVPQSLQAYQKSVWGFHQSRGRSNPQKSHALGTHQGEG